MARLSHSKGRFPESSLVASRFAGRTIFFLPEWMQNDDTWHERRANETRAQRSLPSGSGKKYKQCCLKTEQAQPEDEFLWRRIRRAIEGSPMRMLEFSVAHFGREALPEAWDDFMPHWEGEEDEPFTMDTPHMPVFMSWFFYEWQYRYEMLGIYHDIVDRLLNPPMPQLQNTDGDPIVFNKLIYDLECAPRTAFDALRQLNLTEDDESIPPRVRIVVAPI